jgi:hypothetical protein
VLLSEIWWASHSHTAIEIQYTLIRHLLDTVTCMWTYQPPCVKDAQDVARIRARYQEPKGLRKSKRVAGKAADPTGPEPQGQYVQSEDGSDISSVSSLHEPSAIPDLPADSGQDTTEERAIGRPPSSGQIAHAT